MTDFDEIIKKYETQIRSALSHFNYSYKKVLNLPIDVEKLDEESLETWESFSSRFSRVVDLFLTKYIRAKVLKEDPGFHGTLRDFVNYSKKMGLIKNSNLWMAMREVKNIEAHTYTEDLQSFLKNLLKYAPTVSEISERFQ